MTNPPTEQQDSPDPHLNHDLANIKTLEKLRRFSAHMRVSRKTTVFENHAIAVRYVELRRVERERG